MINRRARGALAILLGLGLAGCGGGSTNLPAPTPNVPGALAAAPGASELSGRIAYSQIEPGQLDPTFDAVYTRQPIYIGNADGSARVRVTPATVGSRNEQVALSSDGERALCSSNARSGRSRLF